jgi:hypothetical protein
VTNFPATNRVQILLNDQVVPSLGGHVDLARPLPPDMTLLALPSPSPAPSPLATNAPPPAGATPAAPAPR